MAEAYPDAFRKLRDVALPVSPEAAGNLGGVEVGAEEIGRRLRDESVTRVWLNDCQSYGVRWGVGARRRVGVADRE